MRRLAAALFTLLYVSLWATPVAAATVLDFSPTGGLVGHKISGTTRGDWGIPSGRVVILLAPTNRIVDRAVSPNERGLTRFGVVTFDASGIGSFEGRVPALEPGRYIAAGYCKSCGGTIFTVGEFVVGGAGVPRTGGNVNSVLVLALATIGMGFAIWHRTARPPSRS
jgi:hypothetical protein